MHPSPVQSREALQAAIAAGFEPEYLFFWGHTPKVAGVVDKSCLSQWFPAPFTHEGATFATAEHYMMVAKARLFGDAEAEARILAATSPAEAKKIGRQVRGYDDAAWGRARLAAVIEGNALRFGQNPDQRDFLLSTGDKVLVEAAPRDRIWGIGMGASNPDAADPNRWRGRNLLGFALMAARHRLRQA